MGYRPGDEAPLVPLIRYREATAQVAEAIAGLNADTGGRTIAAPILIRTSTATLLPTGLRCGRAGSPLPTAICTPSLQTWQVGSWASPVWSSMTTQHGDHFSTTCMYVVSLRDAA